MDQVLQNAVSDIGYKWTNILKLKVFLHILQAWQALAQSESKLYDPSPLPIPNAGSYTAPEDYTIKPLKVLSPTSFKGILKSLKYNRGLTIK